MEVWKKIKHYPSYEVSNHGQVRRQLKSGRYRDLKLCDNGNGYLRLNLCKDGRQYKAYIHRLVAGAFLTNKKGFPEVHHKDHDKTNNTLSNLEWVSSKTNNAHKTVYYRNLKQRNTINGNVSNP